MKTVQAYRAAAVLSILMMVGCAQSEKDTGALAITVAAKASAVAQIASVTATITGPEIARPFVVPMGARGAVWQTNVFGIPAGVDRVISVAARSEDGAALFHGQALGVTIEPGGTAQVSIVLRDVSANVPYTNTAPTLDALEVSAVQVLPSDTVAVSVRAHDADPTDVLAYRWSATCGALAEPTVARTTWTAPDVAATCDVRITVTDSRGASVHGSVRLAVAPSTRGGAAITTRADLSPTIAAIGLSPAPLRPGAPVVLNVTASDLDGQPLSFAWSSSCTGTFDDSTLQSPTFTLQAAPSSGTCQFTVDVSDPLGAHSIGVLNQTTALAPVDQAPVVETASQSRARLAANETATLQMQAYDPEGRAIAFTWSATHGQVTSVVTDEQTWSAAFMAPAVLPDEPMRVTLVVTDAGGLSSQVVFEFNRPNHAPTIRETSLAPSPIVVGMPARLSVVATDPDGDSLSYLWAATCEGVFDNPTSATPTFHLVSAPPGAYCSFSVVVTDDAGAQAVGGTSAIINHLPVVESITLSTDQILVGQPVGLALVVSDADGDAWTVSWSRSCDGSFDDTTSRAPTFTLGEAPASKRCSFTATVTDARGGQAMRTVAGSVGSAPVIADVQVGQLPLMVGQPAQLSAVASDADGDPLTFAWASDCAGGFAAEATAAPTFTLVAVPPNRLCTFQVLVTDGRGGASVGQVAGQVGPIVVNQAPVIDAWSQGWAVVDAGDLVPLSVSASDPEGEPVSYAWSSTDGTLGGVMVVPDTSYSSAFWTPPAVLPSGTMQVTVVVSDPSGLQSSITFDFIGDTQ